jgi:hypothetical protein
MADDRARRHDLNEEIDRAVREMTNVDPLPGFDERVRRRLERPLRHTFAWPRLLTAGAAAAAVLVLAIVLRDDPGSVQRSPQSAPPSPAAATNRPAPATRTPAPTATPRPSSTVQLARTTARPKPRPEREVTAATIDVGAVEELIPTVAALPPPSALEVKAIGEESVNVPAIKMEAIAISQLNVQPLRPLEERPKE